MGLSKVSFYKVICIFEGRSEYYSRYTIFNWHQQLNKKACLCVAEDVQERIVSVSFF